MQPVIVSAAITGVCAIAVALITALFSHAAGKRAGAAQMLTSVQGMWEGITKSLREEITRLTKKVEDAEKRCEAAEEHHRSCRSELDQLWATVRKQPVPAYVDPKPQPRKRRKPDASDS